MIKLLLFSLLCFSCNTKLNNQRFFEFTYEVDINSTNGKKLEMWIPVPQSNEVQTISKLSINSNGLNYSIEKEEKHGNKYIYINHEPGTIKPTKLIMTFNVLRSEHKNVNYKNVSPNEYLGSYNNVPVGGIFNKVIKENNLSKKNIRGIYDYVLKGMHYGKPKSFDNEYYNEPWLNPRDKYGMKKVSRDVVVNLYKKSKIEKNNYTFGNGNSIYACDIGVGNCTDYHSYFMSLDRTLGIPARFHMGFPIPSGEKGTVGGYHCWADYYVENEGWYPVDISEAEKHPEKTDYFFGTVDNNRVEMVVGRDFNLKGNESGSINLFIYPIMEVDNKNSSAYSKKFSYKNLS